MPIDSNNLFANQDLLLRYFAEEEAKIQDAVKQREEQNVEEEKESNSA
jgi:hypothetical protein